MKKLLIGILTLGLMFCFAGNVGAVDKDEVNQPYYMKKFKVIELDDKSYYLSTSALEYVDPEKDVGYLIDRKNGVWEYNKAWDVKLKMGTSARDEVVSIFRDKITPIMDRAFPEDIQLTVSAWIVSKKMVIVFDQYYWRNKKFHEEMCEKVNFYVGCKLSDEELKMLKKGLIWW